MAAVTDEEALHPAAIGQLRLLHIQIHSVDGGHLEHHVIIEDISDTARYGHSWASVGRAASRPTNRWKRFIHRAAGHGPDPAGWSTRRTVTSQDMPSGIRRSPGWLVFAVVQLLGVVVHDFLNGRGSVVEDGPG